MRLDSDSHKPIPSPDIPAATQVVADTPEATEAWAVAQAKRPIDLTRACYVSRIATHADHSVTWFLNVHHIVNDAFSIQTILGQVEAAYQGRPLSLAPYSLEALVGADEDLTPAITHWQTRQAVPPLDRLYGHLARHDGAAMNLSLGPVPQPVTQALEGRYRLLTPGLSATVFWVFITALLLHRASGATAFSIGLIVSHQGRAGVANTIGPRFEIFPVDIQVAADDTFKTLHARCAGAVLTTLRHAKPGCAPDGAIDAVVNLIPATVVPDRFLGHEILVSYLQSGAIDPSHALRLHVSPYAQRPDAPAGQTLALDVAADGAGGCAPGQIAGHVQRLMSHAVTDPDAVIAAADILSPDEHRTLADWGIGDQPQSAPPLNQALEGALKGAFRTVLTDGAVQLTGDALWSWALAVAADLERQNAPARIGVELDPSAAALAAIYGIVLSGRAFVPIPPAHPPARRQRLCDLAGLAVVLTNAADILALQGGPQATPALDDPKAEAYVLFTSGSTGDPRGVPISRAGLAGYLTHALHSYVTPGVAPVAPLFGSLGFDLTLTTLFAQILAGGEVMVFAGHAAQAMTQIAQEPRLTWMKATPSHLELFAGALSGTHGLRDLVVGGEVFGAPLARRLDDLAHAPLRQFNEYGPTETVVGCVLHQLHAQDLQGDGGVPIGRAIAGVHLAVMGPMGDPVAPVAPSAPTAPSAPGAMGELWIASAGMMPRYLDTSPEASGIVIRDGRRYFRSGDLVQIAADGGVSFHGRMDDQVKIGGIRLDPVEIEATLTRHPDIDQAVVRNWRPAKAQPKHLCPRCGLPDTVPGARFDDDGICQTCHDFDRVKQAAQSWFKTPQDLRNLLNSVQSRARGKYTCMHLLSGGKDSTYALYQLVELGHRPYVVTLDNGYISDGARANIDRCIAHLGLDHAYLSTPAMGDILNDSLQRYSNVCNGCYKAIYTLATLKAKALDISVIMTGLSRGQLFETRLVPQQFVQGFDPDEIDRAVLAARKRYHRADDAIRRLLDTDPLQDDALFDQIAFVDFYRFLDVPLSEVLRFLDRHTEWQRPADTGRSTNCLVNETGIHVHLRERGFHNYAIPYAWDVRLGHKTRDEAIEELNDPFDRDRITAQLAQIGYAPQERAALAAWVVPGPRATPSLGELRAFLADHLPGHAIPHSFTAVDHVALTVNGKVDLAALPVPARDVQPRIDVMAQAMSPAEETIVTLWEDLLGQTPISPNYDFFALGGDSLLALNMAFALGDGLGRAVSETLVFQYTTPRTLAGALGNDIAAPPVPAPTMPSAVTPGGPPQMTALEEAILLDGRAHPGSTRYNTGRVFHLPGTIPGAAVEQAVHQVAARHVPLCWSHGAMRRPLPKDQRVAFVRATTSCACDEVANRHAALLQAPYDLDNGPLLRVAVQPTDGGNTALVLAAHHVACDHASFSILLRDILAALAGRLPQGPAPDYPSVFRALFSAPQPDSVSYWQDLDLPAPAPILTRRDESDGPDGRYLRAEMLLPRAQLRAGRGTPLAAQALAAAGIAIAPFLAGTRVDMGLISGREGHAADDVFGCLINTLPVSVPVDMGETVGQIAGHAKHAVAQVLPHRHVPLSTISALRHAAGHSFAPPRFLVSVVEAAGIDHDATPVREEYVHAEGGWRP